jgi:hypothetical protein
MMGTVSPGFKGRKERRPSAELPPGQYLVGRPLDPATTEALRFNPWITGEGIVPVGRLNRLRRPSYASSQQGRPAGIARR